MLAALLEVIEYLVFMVLFVSMIIAVLWCFCRIYLIALRKGLRPADAMGLIMVSAIGGGWECTLTVLFFPTERWSEAAENAAIFGAVLLAPLVCAVAVVVVVPRGRSEAGGPRPIPFVFSLGARRLEAACRWFALSIMAVAVTTPLWSSWDLGLRLLAMVAPLLGVRLILDHFRKPTLAPIRERMVRSDARPLLYLRPFAREADPFICNHSALGWASSLRRPVGRVI